MLWSALKRHADFQKVKNQGKRFVSSDFILQAYFFPSEEITLRLGIIASKKVGNAVARNRAKRRIRALARDLLPVPTKTNIDYVIIARKSLITADFQSLKTQFDKAIKYVNG